MTFAKRFAQYAYHTVVSGKLHHCGPDQMQGWTQRIAPDTEVNWQYIDGRQEAELEKYMVPQGTGKWSNQKEIERANITYGHYQRFDERAVGGAVQFIQDYFNDPNYDRPQGHRPLMLKVSLKQPHYPFFAEEDKFNYYLNRVPVFQEERCDHPVLSRTQYGPPVEAAERDIRRATAAYYSMVEKVDAHFQEIADALAVVGQNLDDWIIIYTSDHGDMLGEHGIWEKTQFYEGSVRVPLIIRCPEKFSGGRTIDKNVNLVDLFATLCELAGIPVPVGLDSRSLVPFLKDQEVVYDNETISHMWDNRLMIKKDSLKYLSFGSDIPEVLFDLKHDPLEKTNLISDPGYTEQLSRFRQRRNELGYN
jgi:choline-sulfatase